MTAMALRFHARYYRPWIAPFGLWVCIALFMLVNAIDAMARL